MGKVACCWNFDEMTVLRVTVKFVASEIPVRSN